MRRKTIFTALSFLLTLGFAGCSQEEVAPPAEGQEIRVATRSTGEGEAFTDDFTLELWSTTDNAKYETHSMTYTDGTGWNIVKSSILPANAFAYKGS